MLLTTKFMLDDDQRTYLENIGITQKQLTALENDVIDAIPNINTLIKVLFTCNKVEDAWDNIRANLEVVDFADIMSSPYVAMDRTATDVFDYMYANSIIDTKSYMYFEVLSGALNNWDFWKNTMHGLSTTNKLELLHDSFNDIFVQQKISPYELGLVHLTPEQYDYIFSNIEEGEKVDFIFEDKPCIDVDVCHIQELLYGGHLDPEKCIKYFNIIFKIYSELYDIEDALYTEFYYEFFNSIDEYYTNILKETSSTITSYIDIFSSLHIDTLSKMCKIIDWFKMKSDLVDAYKYSDHNILKFVLNNPLTLSNTFTLINYINPFDLNGNDILFKLSNYLNDSINLEYAISYSIHPYFSTDDYIIKYLFPGSYTMIYSKKTNMILLGNNIKEFEKSDFAFIDDYEIAETVNDDIFINFNNIDEYKEFILAAKVFRDKIYEHLEE